MKGYRRGAKSEGRRGGKGKEKEGRGKRRDKSPTWSSLDHGSTAVCC